MVYSKLKSIHDLGQSIWLDFFDRHLLDSGALEKWIDEDGISGITSNPAIFEKAFSSSSDYDADIATLSKEIRNTDDLFLALAVRDIRRAADFFRVMHTKNADDGFVSIEVLPQLAYDTAGTIEQAKTLWRSVDRDNVMIKIPATAAGLRAIRQCTSEGININITLLFGLPRYLQVVDAYISGLEDRVKTGKPIDHIASVASFFLSRIDVLIDPLLKAKNRQDLEGKVAIASAKKAYQLYHQAFSSERFKKLEAKGAQRQRLLWASTGTKDPSYSDVKYVEALIGPETINTVPLNTLKAFKDHGHALNALDSRPDQAVQVLAQVAASGIDLDALTQQLEDEGIRLFNQAYDKLRMTLDQKASSPNQGSK